jgi:hypothetical protein
VSYTVGAVLGFVVIATLSWWWCRRVARFDGLPFELVTPGSSSSISRLHDHALPLGRHDHPLLICDFDFVFTLFLFDFFREPFFHETRSSALSTLIFEQTYFRTARSSEPVISLILRFRDGDLLLSASKTTLDRHNGHSALPALCILTKHLTQKR